MCFCASLSPLHRARHSEDTKGGLAVCPPNDWFWLFLSYPCQHRRFGESFSTCLRLHRLNHSKLVAGGGLVRLPSRCRSFGLVRGRIWLMPATVGHMMMTHRHQHVVLSTAKRLISAVGALHHISAPLVSNRCHLVLDCLPLRRGGGFLNHQGRLLI